MNCSRDVAALEVGANPTCPQQKTQGPDVEMGTLVQQPDAGASDDASSHLLGNPSALSVGDISAMAVAPPPAASPVLPASEDGSSSSVRASNHHLQEDGGRQPIAGTATTDISDNLLLGSVARRDDEKRSWHVNEDQDYYDMNLWFGSPHRLKRSFPLKTALLDFCHDHDMRVHEFGFLFHKKDSSKNPFGLRKELFTAILEGDDETARNLLVVNTDAAADRQQDDGETILNPSSFPQQQHGHHTNKYKDDINGSLLFAALLGRTALALDLVKQYGANLTEAIFSNVLPCACTAFDLAAIADHKETLEALLNHVLAADEQQQMAGGGSSAAGYPSAGDVMDAALHWATFAGSFDCVKLLIQKAGVPAIERGVPHGAIYKGRTPQTTESFKSGLYDQILKAAYELARPDRTTESEHDGEDFLKPRMSRQDSGHYTDGSDENASKAHQHPSSLEETVKEMDDLQQQITALGNRMQNLHQKTEAALKQKLEGSEQRIEEILDQLKLIMPLLLETRAAGTTSGGAPVQTSTTMNTHAGNGIQQQAANDDITADDVIERSAASAPAVDIPHSQ